MLKSQGGKGRTHSILKVLKRSLWSLAAHPFFFFFITWDVRTSLRVPRLIPGSIEHPASPVGRQDTAKMTDVHAKA
jgi:hypothetical protein